MVNQFFSGQHRGAAYDESKGRIVAGTAAGRHTMKIVIIGGTGRIGSKVVTLLRERRHQAVPASPDSGVNTLTGQGLAEVLAGAAVVVDVSNSPSFEDAAVLKFFETSTTNLLAAEGTAGISAPKSPRRR